MMNRQIRVDKLLVQLNVLPLVAQLKFNPSKREIRLLLECFLTHSIGSVAYAVLDYLEAAIELPKRKNP